MPLGDLPRTLTNMGGEAKEDDSWKVYEPGTTPIDPTMIEMGATAVAGRQLPHHIDPPKKKQSKPKRRSQRLKEADEKALEAARNKDLSNRNIRNPKTNAATSSSEGGSELQQ